MVYSNDSSSVSQKLSRKLNIDNNVTSNYQNDDQDLLSVKCKKTNLDITLGDQNRNFSFKNNKIEPIYKNPTYIKHKFEDFRKKHPRLSKEEVHRLIVVEHGLLRLKRLTYQKQTNYKAETFFGFKKIAINFKQTKLKIMYMNKLLNTNFTKHTEFFFLIYKKLKFLDDIDLQRTVFMGPQKIMNRTWGGVLYNALNKLRVFNNIVNQYEYHIQPFQKRSIKNNIIGLLRDMRLNNHNNQRILLRDPKLLKIHLLSHITDKLIRGKSESQMELFFTKLKGQTQDYKGVSKKLKRLDFMMRGMVRTRFGWFFREFLLQNQSIMDGVDDKSRFSKNTRMTSNNKRYQDRYLRNLTNINEEGYNPSKTHFNPTPTSAFGNVVGFDFGEKRVNGSPLPVQDSNRVINSFYQIGNDGLREVKTSYDVYASNTSDVLKSSHILDSQTRRSILKNSDKRNYLLKLLQTLERKRNAKVFEEIRITSMMKTFMNKRKMGDITKSYLNLKVNIGKEKMLPYRLMAMILDRTFKYKNQELVRNAMTTLKNKEIQIYKVLFGKVTAMKSQVYGDTASQIASQQLNGNRSMVNSASYVNFQRPSQGDHLSAFSNFLFE